MIRRFGNIERLHFVGIAGMGMCGMAEVLHNWGFKVQGSDLNPDTEVGNHLKSLDIKIFKGHAKEYVRGVDVVVHSTAVKQDNQELVAAREDGIMILSRAEMLAEILRLKRNILIAGSHGKTTTTSMVAHMLKEAKLSPTAVIGGRFKQFASNVDIGKSDWLVAEADESDGTFLSLQPEIAVVTNIETEHMDYYLTEERLENAFVDFLNKVPFYGVNVLCLDNDRVKRIMPLLKRRTATYGFHRQAHWRAENVVATPKGMDFQLYHLGVDLGVWQLGIWGKHNVENALAAVAVGFEMQVDQEIMRSSLATFSGVKRRLEVCLSGPPIWIIDDYAHHPTEVKATLPALREAFPENKILAIFQPHRYSRFTYCFDEFCVAFDDVDEVWVTDVYNAGEEAFEGSKTPQDFVEASQAQGFPSHHIPTDLVLKEATDKMKEWSDAEENGVIVFLGAGSSSLLAHQLAEMV